MAKGNQSRRFLSCALAGAVVSLSLLPLAGCSGQSSKLNPVPHAASLTGTVYGGRLPITNATVLAYAAATAAGARPTEIGTAATDSSGRFSITFSPTPTTGQITYVTVAGGNAGAGTNGAIGLMTVAGAYCNSGTSGCDFYDNVTINELTTIAATAALQRYVSFADCSKIRDNTQSGTCLSIVGAHDLSRAARTVGNLVNVAKGQAAAFLTSQAATSGNPIHVTLTKMDTLANVLAACVNTSGPTASACSRLFGAVLNRPKNTLQAAYDISAWPAVNAKGHAFYALAGAFPIFAPTLATSPAEWTIAGQRFAFVANSGDNTISVDRLSSLTGALTKVAGSPFAAGNVPGAVVLDPATRLVYATNQAGNDVSAYAIDPATGALVPITTGGAGNCGTSPESGNCFPAGSAPHDLTEDPSGKFLYAANYGSNDLSAYTINSANGALTPVAGAPFAAGNNPSAIAIDPVGKILYVANYSSNNVSAYTIGRDGALIAVAGSPFAAGNNPSAIAIDSGGKFLYVADYGGNDVSAYTIGSDGALTDVAGTSCGTGLPNNCFTAGTAPRSLAANPGGQYLYVADYGSDEVSAYSIGNDGALADVAGSPFSAGTQPSSISAGPNGRFLYVANYGSHDVSAYTIGKAGVLTLVHVATPFTAGDFTDAVVADPSGRYVYAVNSNCHDPNHPCVGTTGSVSAWHLDSTTGALVKVSGSPFAAGSSPELATIDPTGRFLYVANRNDDDVQAYTLDSTTGALKTLGTYFTGSGPYSVATDPAGKFLYVTNFDATSTAGLSAFDIDSGGILAGIGTFPTGSGPLSVTVTANGNFAYVANHTSGDISGYTIGSNGALSPVSASSPFPAGTSTDWVATDPASRLAYAVNFADNSISAYTIAPSDAPAPGVLTQISGSPFDEGAGTAPRSLAVDPSRRYLYVANHTGDDVSAYSINPTTGTLRKITGSPFPADNEPLAVTVDPTGRYVYTANHTAGTVSAFTIAPTDASTPGALASVSASSPFPAGNHPSSIAAGP